MTRRRQNKHRIGCAGSLAIFALLMVGFFLFDTFGGFAWLNQ